MCFPLGLMRCIQHDDLYFCEKPLYSPYYKQFCLIYVCMDAQQLAHLSRLAAIKIAPDKEAAFLAKMDQVLAFVAQVQQCPLDEASGVSSEGELVLQPRQAGEAYAEPDGLLATTTHPIVQGQIVVKTGESLDNG